MYNFSMSRNIPSPIALRAFEAAARHLSFTRAAQELSVTQSAVSHQVKALEGDLGVRLFLRLTRQLRLTKVGETLLAVLRGSYDRIEETVNEIQSGSDASPLSIGLTSYFASRWLTRRIGRFSAQHPDIEMRLHLANDPINFDRMDLDLAVAWGRGDWPGLVSELLVPTRVIVVCSPALIKEGPPLRELADLRHHTLLHEMDHVFWHDWLAASGAGAVVLGASVTMNDPNVVHQAAIEGQGVALGAEAFLDDEISQGRLVQPFDRAVELDGAYYLVHPYGARNRPNVNAFCEWLSVETRTTGPRSSRVKSVNTAPAL